MNGLRIFLAGVGGQGTLTATVLLARIALDKDMQVTAGEIHGMAQRGGIVESTLLLGGFLSPRISSGEADVLLGFEPLETLRALHYLKPGGTVFSNTDPTMPVAVSRGEETYPDLEYIQNKTRACAGQSFFLPCKELAAQTGNVQSSNTVLLGAFCGAKASPFSLQDLQEGIQRHLPPKIAAVNIQAAGLGVQALA
ncbi:MAG: indolepyruvate oxidoreductase subunit beta [Desulfohalobiaceae bacterium]